MFNFLPKLYKKNKIKKMSRFYANTQDNACNADPNNQNPQLHQSTIGRSKVEESKAITCLYTQKNYEEEKNHNEIINML